MSSMKHGMKKRLSHFTTRTKTIEAKMSSDYTAEKHTLHREKTTLEKALKLLTSTRASWLELGKAQKAMTDLVVTDATVDSQFYPRAAGAAAATNSLYEHLASPPSPEAIPQRLEAHVRAYLAEIASVEKKFADVEANFTEVSRYEKKVGKLSDRSSKTEKTGAKAEKANERTRRNLDKLASERAVYTSKLDGVVESMKRTSGKFETILTCVHAAFWLQQDSILADSGTHTFTVRDQVKIEADSLVKIDVALLQPAETPLAITAGDAAETPDEVTPEAAETPKAQAAPVEST